jgi:flagellin
MTVINTNVNALFSQNAMKVNNRNLSTAMEQLSTGQRINSAKDLIPFAKAVVMGAIKKRR